jgi:hypothetical protein
MVSLLEDCCPAQDLRYTVSMTGMDVDPKRNHCFVLMNRHLHGLDKLLFHNDDQKWFCYEPKTMLDLLVQAEIFPSKGQARKNWNGPVEIPPGWSEYHRIGKYRQSVFVLNPIHDDDCPCEDDQFVAKVIKEIEVENAKVPPG